MHYLKKSQGFTLVELIVVMMVTSLISGTLLFFLQRTITGYAQAKERVQSVTQTSGVISRIKREIRLALPNSLRVSTVNGVVFIEWVPVVTAGRYRVSSATGTDSSPVCPNDNALITDNGVLTIGQVDTCFKTIGEVSSSSISIGDWVVVFNAGEGYAGANVYETGNNEGGNKVRLQSISSNGYESRLTMNPITWNNDAPGHRFYVTKNPITYRCDPQTGELTRWSGYPMQSNQPTNNLSGLSGVSSAVMMNKINSCNVVYGPGTLNGQMGVLSWQISQSTSSGDPVNTHLQIQVNNSP